MKQLWQSLLACSLILAGMFVTASPSFAAECHSVNAKGTGKALSATTTTARITGGGLLNGTTAGEFTAGSPFSGTITLTTNSKETVIISIPDNGGHLNPDGTFDATGIVTSGTGKYAGATGSLLFNGQITSAQGDFIETVTGSLCLQK